MMITELCHIVLCNWLHPPLINNKWKRMHSL